MGCSEGPSCKEGIADAAVDSGPCGPTSLEDPDVDLGRPG